MGKLLAYPPTKDISLYTNRQLWAFLQEFDMGYYSTCAKLMENCILTDPDCSVSNAKRISAVSRHNWRFDLSEDTAEARLQADTFEHFLRRFQSRWVLSNTYAVGYQPLCEMLLSAVGFRFFYGKFSILGDDENADFRIDGFPLWALRRDKSGVYLLTQDGEERLNDLIIGQSCGIMLACLKYVRYKWLCLESWSNLNAQQSKPNVVGKTASARGSSDWEAFEEEVAAFAEGEPAVIDDTDSVESVNRFKGTTYTSLMDDLYQAISTAIITAWRGGDLATRSVAHGTGASLQKEELSLLELADVVYVETLMNEQIFERIRLKFDWPRLCNFKILDTYRGEVQNDLNIDRFLIEAGVKLSKTEALARYGRREGENNEDILKLGDFSDVPQFEFGKQ